MSFKIKYFSGGGSRGGGGGAIAPPFCSATIEVQLSTKYLAHGKMHAWAVRLYIRQQQRTYTCT